MAITLTFETPDRHHNAEILSWMEEQTSPIHHWTSNIFCGIGWDFRVVKAKFADRPFVIEMTFEDELLALEFKLKWL